MNLAKTSRCYLKRSPWLVKFQTLMQGNTAHRFTSAKNRGEVLMNSGKRDWRDFLPPNPTKGGSDTTPSPFGHSPWEGEIKLHLSEISLLSRNELAPFWGDVSEADRGAVTPETDVPLEPRRSKYFFV